MVPLAYLLSSIIIDIALTYNNLRRYDIITLTTTHFGIFATSVMRAQKLIDLPTLHLTLAKSVNPKSAILAISLDANVIIDDGPNVMVPECNGITF